jgi:PAS domain S-box-containing protein
VHDSEEQYRRVVELSPEGIFISRDARIVFVNPAALRMFGASSPEQVLGRSPLDFFRADRHPSIRERIRLLMDGGSVPTIE